MSTQEDDDFQTLLRCAWWYYIEGKTQADIATSLHTSRASVGRMLDKARNLGIVNISLSPEYFTGMQLARELKEAYQLKDAMVVPMHDTASKSSEAISEQLGIGAAQILSEYLEADKPIGIGWGQTVGALLSVLPAETLADNPIISLTGGVTAYMQIMFQMKTRANVNAGGFIPTPIFVSDTSLASFLRKEDSVQSVLQRAKDCHVAVIGIGAVSEQSTLTQTGFASVQDVSLLKEQGATGDVIGLFYDIHGEVMDTPLLSRRIGIDIQTLKAIPTVIGIAGGVDKIDAIQAALEGNIIDILITDEDVAQAILLRAPAHE